MKHILVFLFCLATFAQSVPPGGGKPLLVSDDAGSTIHAARKLYFPSGTLSCSGATCTFTSSGGGSISSGTYASLPAAGNSGSLYIATDAPYILYDNGSSWTGFGPISKLTPPPAASSFTWVNQGGASTDETKGGLILTVPAASGDNVRGLAIAVPSSPYTFTAAIMSGVPAVNYAAGGIGLRESSSGKLVTIGHTPRNNQVECYNWNSETSLASSYGGTTAASPSTIWLRIKDDGTNRIIYQSGNGVFWTQVSSTTRTDFITPDQLFVWGNSNNGSSLDVKLWVLHWLTE